MQAGEPPEELHAILSRFNTWASKQPNGRGRGDAAPEEGVREIPYEEAIRQHRSRQAVPGQRSKAAPKPKATAAPPQPAAKPSNTPSVSLSEPQEELPLWVTNLPVVADTEPVIELKVARTPDQASGKAAAAAPGAAIRTAPIPPRRARHSSVKQSPAAPSNPKPIEESAREALLAALPELQARSFVDLPPGPLSKRSKPQRRVIAPSTVSSQRKIAAAAVEPAPRTEPVPTMPPPAKATQTKPPATAAKTAPSASAVALPRPSKPTTRAAVAKPALIRPTSKMALPLPSQPSIPRRASPARVARRKVRDSKRPAFRKVLASTVQQPKAVLASRNKPAPDRTRRITTRFSPAEERRIEKCAAELGITVSAYLRQCALAAITQKALAEMPEPVVTAKSRKSPARATEQAMQYAPAPSLFGGWLALLRNRFLGPPVRFTEDA